MPYRKTQFVNDEFFHVFNRGTEKRDIFLDNRDRIRFLFLILYCQSKHNLCNISRQVSYFVKHQVFNISVKETEKIILNRFVSIISFCLMPNHFHILLKQDKENGISEYMQKVQNAYAKYFNTKYNRTGHLFSGPFKSVHVEDNRQLLHLSAYIHKNPKELKQQQNYEKYRWSSLPDYLVKNRWKGLLDPEIILDQFNNKDGYKEFVKTSMAKEFILDLD